MSSPLFFQSPANTISLPPIAALISMAEADRSTSNTLHGHPRRRSRHSRDGFVDLTRDSSSSSSASVEQMPPPYSRNSKEPPVKRRRLEDEASGSHRPSARSVSELLNRSTGSSRRQNVQPHLDLTSLADVEEVDLTRVRDDDGLKKIQDAQRQRHEKLQEQQNHLLKDSVQAQEPEKDGPVKFSNITCVICMENMTNITATHCGHLFCHTCIMEALIAGESGEPGKPQSRCPVCRMKVLRNVKGSTAPQVIPLEIKMLTKSAVARGKERVAAT